MSAPLPFMGQKRTFAAAFREMLEGVDDASVFVDLFGGSGLLSHIARRVRPGATVVYNDFDGYSRRLAAVGDTNRLLCAIREIAAGVPRHKAMPREVKGRICALLEGEEAAGKFVDYITLSSSLLFSMKYAVSLDDLRRHTMYNNVRKVDYRVSEGYLDGLEVVSCDYRELFARYRGRRDVVFIVDPPYLSTETKPYTMEWGLADYLDVLTVLKGHRFVYFSSDKSGIVELCEWMGANGDVGNPFEHAARRSVRTHMNYSSEYTDMMLYRL